MAKGARGPQRLQPAVASSIGCAQYGQIVTPHQRQLR
jgi:hypothetical protein